MWRWWGVWLRTARAYIVRRVFWTNRLPIRAVQGEVHLLVGAIVHLIQWHKGSGVCSDGRKHALLAESDAVAAASFRRLEARAPYLTSALVGIPKLLGVLPCASCSTCKRSPCAAWAPAAVPGLEHTGEGARPADIDLVGIAADVQVRTDGRLAGSEAGQVRTARSDRSQAVQAGHTLEDQEGRIGGAAHGSRQGTAPQVYCSNRTVAEAETEHALAAEAAAAHRPVLDAPAPPVWHLLLGLAAGGLGIKCHSSTRDDLQK
jgi:hypothetical protein